MLLRSIAFEGNSYFARDIVINGATLTIGTISLERALFIHDYEGFHVDFVSTEAEELDEKIFFYVADDQIMLSDKQLCLITCDDFYTLRSPCNQQDEDFLSGMASLAAQPDN